MSIFPEDALDTAELDGVLRRFFEIEESVNHVFAAIDQYTKAWKDRLGGRSVMMVHLASFYGRQGKLGPSVYDLAKVAREADQSMEPLKEQLKQLENTIALSRRQYETLLESFRERALICDVIIRYHQLLAVQLAKEKKKNQKDPWKASKLQMQVDEISRSFRTFVRSFLEDVCILAETKQDKFDPVLVAFVEMEAASFRSAPEKLSLSLSEAAKCVAGMAEKPLVPPDFVLNFHTMMAQRELREYFHQFLRSEHSEENMLFWLEVLQLKNFTGTQEQLLQEVTSIFDTYLKSGAQHEVNISDPARLAVMEALERAKASLSSPDSDTQPASTPAQAESSADSNADNIQRPRLPSTSPGTKVYSSTFSGSFSSLRPTSPPPPPSGVLDGSIFTPAVKEVYNLMETDSYERFLKSDFYARLAMRLFEKNLYSFEKPANYDTMQANAQLEPRRPRRMSNSDLLPQTLAAASPSERAQYLRAEWAKRQAQSLDRRQMEHLRVSARSAKSGTGPPSPLLNVSDVSYAAEGEYPSAAADPSIWKQLRNTLQSAMTARSPSPTPATPLSGSPGGSFLSGISATPPVRGSPASTVSAPSEDSGTPESPATPIAGSTSAASDSAGTKSVAFQVAPATSRPPPQRTLSRTLSREYMPESSDEKRREREPLTAASRSRSFSEAMKGAQLSDHARQKAEKSNPEQQKSPVLSHRMPVPPKPSRLEMFTRKLSVRITKKTKEPADTVVVINPLVRMLSTPTSPAAPEPAPPKEEEEGSPRRHHQRRNTLASAANITVPVHTGRESTSDGEDDTKPPLPAERKQKKKEKKQEYRRSAVVHPNPLFASQELIDAEAARKGKTHTPTSAESDKSALKKTGSADEASVHRTSSQGTRPLSQSRSAELPGAAEPSAKLRKSDEHSHK